MSDRQINIDGIRRRLPHRYPMLLLDRVLDFEPNEWLRALKNITVNEPWVDGHFPERPIMPGVLLIEAMAQSCGLLAFVTREADVNGDLPPSAPLFYLVGVDKARFKRPIEPGDSPHFISSLHRIVRGIWLFQATIELDGLVVASADIRCTMRDM